MNLSDEEVVLFKCEAKWSKTKELGTLLLTNLKLQFIGSSGFHHEFAWPNVADAKYAPASANVAAMKVRGAVGSTEEATIELIGGRLEENHADLARVRDLVKDLRQAVVPKKLKVLISTKKRRQQLLDADRELRKRYDQLVRDEKILSEEDFWESHRDRFRDHEVEVESKRLKRGHQHVRSAIMELHKQRTTREDGKVVYTITPDLKIKFFERYPQLRRDFNSQVPTVMTEAEFWAQYLKEEFFTDLDDDVRKHRFVNPVNQHVAVRTYEDHTESIHSHIGARPSQAPAAVAAATDPSRNAVSGNNVPASGVRSVLEQASKKRKFDESQSIIAEVDLTTTFGDYVREQSREDGDELFPGNAAPIQASVPANVIIQQLNDEGFSALLIEEEEKGAKRVEGYDHHQRHHHHHHHHHHSAPNHHQHQSQSQPNSDQSHPPASSSSATEQSSAVTSKGHMVSTSHGAGYEDMDEVLRSLPHRPKVDEHAMHLEKKILEIYQPSVMPTVGIPSVKVLQKNPAVERFEMAMVTLQSRLTAARPPDGIKAETYQPPSKYMPTLTVASKCLKDELARVQKHAKDWVQQSKVSSDSHRVGGHHHHHHSEIAPETPQETQWQEFLKSNYVDIAELLLHYYGLYDRLRQIRSGDDKAPKAADSSSSGLSRAESAIDDKMKTILSILQKKEEAFKRKRQQLQQQHQQQQQQQQQLQQLQQQPSSVLASDINIEGLVKMLDEMIAQIQRATSWSETRRQYSDDMY